MNFNQILRSLFGDKASRDNKLIRPFVEQIKAVYPNSPAQNIGLKEDDIITKIDGIDCENDPYKVVELINNSKKGKIRNRS